MRKSVLTENDYIQFYKAITFGNVDNPISSAVNLAYKDLCRTITGFGKHSCHNIIHKKAVDVLCHNISNLFATEIAIQSDFDLWHKSCCDDLITAFDSQPFYYGQAQKWINMSFKYLSLMDYSLVEHHYEFFHVPIDNYIINITNIKLSVAWSRISDYEEYIKFQKAFSDKYNGIPLDEEFRLWLDAKNK